MSMMVSKARGRVQESIMCPSRVTSSLSEVMGPFHRTGCQCLGASGQQFVLPMLFVSSKKAHRLYACGPEMSAL